MARAEESDEIKSLYRWLSKDPDVTDTAEVSLAADEPEPGSMGWDTDTINVVVSNSLAGLNVVIAATTLWRHNRTTGSRDVRVDTEDASVVLTDDSGDDAEDLAARLDPPGRGDSGGDAQSR
jgi:hypothetical protein